ncbi:hypothetical protein C3747_94g169 [Trypanosoma cruzi]|uniref:Flagellar attachment zone protein 1 conserved domain-containing protein n=1 Tax=Trypanosoma cruzi TaxID=5693 RepID=A0A2V2WIR9_TRYCR|nr:hypothetical protein C3747_94g169 [Trypanosoma cruzi]
MEDFRSRAGCSHNDMLWGEEKKDLFGSATADRANQIGTENAASATSITCEEVTQIEDLELEELRDSNDGFATTRHKLQFSGAGWGFLMEQHYDELYEAFRSSTAKALGLSETDVFGICFSVGSLVAHFSIRHPISMLGMDINQALIKYDYAVVWALYRRGGEKYGTPQLINTGNPLASPAPTKKIKRDNEDGQPMENNAKEDISQYIATPSTAREIRQNKDNIVVGGSPTHSSTHKMSFSGASWGSILKEHMEEIQKAIEHDVSDATGIPGKFQTRLCFEEEKLIVIFTATYENNEGSPIINRQLSEHEYQHIRNIYKKKNDGATSRFKNKEQENSELTQKKRFSGTQNAAHDLPTLQWATQIPENPSTKNAVTIITPRRILLGGNRTVESAMPVETMIVTENYHQDSVVTHHRVQFDGDDWDAVLERKRATLCEAFDAEVCGAVGIPRGSVVDVEFTLGSLSVAFGVRHAPSLSKRDVDKRLDECNFAEVWRLYDRRNDGQQTGDAVGDAVPRTGASEELPVLRASEELPVLRGYEELPRTSSKTQSATKMSFVRGDYSRSAVSVVKPRLSMLGGHHEESAVPIENVMTSNYEEELVVTRHRVQFDGDDWDAVLERKRAALCEAFDADVCGAVDIPRGSVVDLEFKSGGLFAEFGVRHAPSLRKRDVDKRLARCEFRRTWELYEPRNLMMIKDEPVGGGGVADGVVAPEDPVVTRHRVQFDGDDWDVVLERKRAALCEAFDADVCGAVGIPRGSVVDVEFTLGSLSVAFGVRHAPSLSKRDVDKRLDECNFAEVWRLYDRRNDGQQTGDAVGDAVPRTGASEELPVLRASEELPVLRGYEELPRTSSKTQSATKMSFVRGDYSRSAVSVVKPRLSMLGGHHEESAVPIENVMTSNYEEELVVTRHRVQFDGDDWDAVLERKRAALCEAFDADVCGAVDIPRGSVVDLEFKSGGLFAEFGVRHAPSLRKRDVDKRLARCEFRRTWELYEPRNLMMIKDEPVGGGGVADGVVAPEDPVVTRHRVQFDGDDWDAVLERKRAALCEAFDADVCGAVGIPRGSVVDVEFTLGSLSVAFGVRHAPSLSKRDVDKRLDECNFAEVWRLYDRRNDGQQTGDAVGDAVPRTGASEELPVLRASEELPVLRGYEELPRTSSKTQSATKMSFVRGDYSRSVVSVVKPRLSMLGGHHEESAVPIENVMTSNYEEELVVTRHRVQFDGDDWDAVLERKRAALCEAFDADVCGAVDIPRGSVVDLEFKSGGLFAEFGVRHAPSLRKRDVDKRLARCEFRRTWELYEPRNLMMIKDEPVGGGGVADGVVAPEDPVVTRHRVQFDGDDWDVVLERKRAALCEAFDADVCGAVGIPRGSVVDVEFTLGSLSVAFGVRHAPSLSKRDVDKRLDECNFAEVWRLYDRRNDGQQTGDAVGDAVPRTGASEELPVLRASEELPVLRGYEELPRTSSKTQSATKMSFVRGDYSRSVVSVVKPRLSMLGGHHEESAVPIENVMTSNYEEELVVTRHRVQFDGDDWDAVLERKRAALCEAFDADVCGAVDIPRGSVVDLEFKSGGLFAEFGVRHAPSLRKRDVDKRLARCEFRRTWELYEPRNLMMIKDEPVGGGGVADGVVAPEDPVVTRHRVQFDGDDWDVVLERKRAALCEAFDADVCGAVGIPRGSVVDVEFTLGSLSVAFGVRHAPSLSKRDVDKRLDECNFAEVWRLYDRRNDGQQTGDAVGDAVPRTGASEELPVLRASEELPVLRGYEELPRTSSKTQSATKMSFVRGDYSRSVVSVVKPRLSMLGGHHEESAVPIENVMTSNYEEELVVTRHRVQFDGDDWDAVLERKRAALCEAFDADVCGAVDIPRGSVVDLEFKSGGLFAEFGVRHAPSLRKRDVDKRLARCEFRRTWELYEPRNLMMIKDEPVGGGGVADGVVAPEDPVVTRHRVQFDGDDWDAVLERKRAALCEAFDADVCGAVDIPRGSVVDLEFKSGGLFAEFGVRHAPSLRKRDVDKRLARCEFRRTWELYEPRNLMMIKDEPVGGGGVADGVVAPEDPVVTRHRVQFDGDDWDAVLERKRAALCEAFDADVCGAVGIPRGSVVDVEFTLGSLSVAFGVRHAPSLSKRDVDKRLDECNFAEVWRLYDRRNDGQQTGDAVGDAVPRTGASEELPVLRASEELPVLRGYEELPRTSSKTQSATKMSFVRGDYSRSAVSVVKPRLSMLGGHHEESAVPIENVMTSNYEEELVVTRHRVQFDGDDWDAVLERKRAALCEAFDADVCGAVDIPRGSVVDLEFKSGGLFAEFGVRHAPSLRKRDVDKRLARCEFRRTWELYEPRNLMMIKDEPVGGGGVADGVVAPEDPVVTRHRVQFDGDDWDVVLERKRAALCEAFDADVCGAVGIPRGSVVDVEFTLGSLSVAFGVRHAPSLSKRDVDKRLDECNFAEVWRLYDRRNDGQQTGDAVGDAVPRTGASDSMLPVLHAAEYRDAISPRLQSCDAVLPVLSAAEYRDASLSRLQSCDAVLPVLSAAEYRDAISPRLQSCDAVLPVLYAAEYRDASLSRLQSCDAVLPVLSAAEYRDASLSRLQSCDAVLPVLHAAEYRDASSPMLLSYASVLPALSAAEYRDASLSRLQSCDAVLPVLSAAEYRDASLSRLQSCDAVLPVLYAAEYRDASLSRLQSCDAVLPVLHSAEYRNEDPVVTRHRVQFDGDDWDAVLERKRATLCEAFDADVCGAVGIPRGSVVDVEFTLGSLSVAFGVRHAPSLSKRDVDKRLDECNFAEVWRLYDRRNDGQQTGDAVGDAVPRTGASDSMLPVLHAAEYRDAISPRLQSCDAVLPVLSAAEGCSFVRKSPVGIQGVAVPLRIMEDVQSAGLQSADVVDSLFRKKDGLVDREDENRHFSHSVEPSKLFAVYRIGFLGKGWRSVVDKHLSRLKDCFLYDLSDISKFVPRSVEGVSCSSSGDVVVTVLLEHLSSLSQNEVLRMLDDAPFLSMWRLHDECIAEGSVGRTTTFHRVGFVGADWSSKINGDLVGAAFVKDVVEVLHVRPEDVRIAGYYVSENLVIDFYVEHSDSISEGQIDELLNATMFENVWEVYRRERGPVMQELQPLRVTPRQAKIRANLSKIPKSVAARQHHGLYVNNLVGYPRPGLRYRQPRTDLKQCPSVPEEPLYVPHEKHLPTWDRGVELPNVALSSRAMPWPLRTDYSKAQQQRRVNLNEVSEVLGLQRQQGSQLQPESADIPNACLGSSHQESGSTRRGESRDRLHQYRERIRRLRPK